jgi:hypothetical protein
MASLSSQADTCFSKPFMKYTYKVIRAARAKNADKERPNLSMNLWRIWIEWNERQRLSAALGTMSHAQYATEFETVLIRHPQGASE